MSPAASLRAGARRRGAGAAPPPCAAASAAEDAPAADPVAEATRLRDEGKGFFETAGDTDLSRDERKKARKEAYDRLGKAKALLDGWLETHPGDAERLDDLYSDIAVTMYWLRKEGGVGEFGGLKPTPSAAGPAPAPPGPAPEAAPKPPSAADVLADILAYEAAHPGDVPGAHERFNRFLSDFPDRNAPEYAEALQHVEKLSDRLKDVYRRARDDDPDSLADADPSELVRLVEQLAEDLGSPEPNVRVRAARFLGSLGSGKAADALLPALLKEDDSEAFEAMKESLARIGGRRVCEGLVKVGPDSEKSGVVLDLLLLMVKKGGVNARIAGEAAARFAARMDEAARAEAAEALFAAGTPGALGLSSLVELSPVEKKPVYIEHLGAAGDPRVAGNLARFLVVNPQGARRAQHQAAVKAIQALGKPAVRHLIPVLDVKENQVWTAEVLRQITGAKPKDDKRKTWEKWFRENRRSVEGR